MTALVIDDSRVVRQMMRRVLIPLGFTITEAEDGRQGLERLREMGRPDVIMVDWNMPEMNGLDFVKTVRSDEHFAGLCVMMVTTQAEMEHVTTALEAGVSEYVMKPFTPEVIQEKLALLGIRPA